jgi:carbon-monoxide dehydrogenase small subunit
MPRLSANARHTVRFTLNGRHVAADAQPRMLLTDFLRHDLGMTGVHVGCEHGVCGACTIIVDGLAVRSCLMFAVQADGAEVTTVEGVANADGTLHPVQQAMRECHALQCGFCTPGVVMTLASLAADDARPAADTMLEAMSGHLCRCTGYQGIRKAIDKLAEAGTSGGRA